MGVGSRSGAAGGGWRSSCGGVGLSGCADQARQEEHAAADHLVCAFGLTSLLDDWDLRALDWSWQEALRIGFSLATLDIEWMTALTTLCAFHCVLRAPRHRLCSRRCSTPFDGQLWRMRRARLRVCMMEIVLGGISFSKTVIKWGLST